MRTENPTRSLLVDMSPLFYSNFISVSNQMKQGGLKKDSTTGKLPFTYKSELIYAIVNEAISMNGFGCDEIIWAFDNSQGGYWRKQEYGRYKYSRKKERDESDLDWEAVFPVFDELKHLFDNFSGRVVDVPGMEADDIAFTLAEYLQDRGGVTLVSLDGDWQHALNYKNVRLYKTRKTQRKDGIFVTLSEEELREKELEHCVGGDEGDGFKHIKAWSQFSDEFLEEYPRFKGRELDLYDKHHEIEHRYNLKHNYTKSAYKHPRFGYKMFKRSKKTLEELLEENPIYRKNYELNRQLCLPTSIPQKYKDQIIKAYKNANPDKNPGEITKYFMTNNLFELTGSIGVL